ncbi:putative ATPase,plasmid segregation protein ParM,PRTRC system protein D,Hydantoinase/oxoprolinase [[Clostridium] sordellii]|uniref:ParM/StbA family protein n=1 Tax=Paraclostridium sordellii TaxID=1505 RepID=UPI000543AB83|nr:ParM/StbA family protein [Paeniclostridium sordellii]CEK36485.1 putative ATPase,plasmid segregation protein ParM,PRTRC system protein D,Hydantoinase/oxoprolinase [[Clostridium] sordellii] [Paeniclostridium sordellii]
MNIVKAGIDLGNSMLKGATFIDGKLVLRKLPNKIQYSKTINPKARIIIRDGKTIYLGVGELNNNVLKHTRKNLLDQVLVMINELYPDENELSVDLRLGLPPVQFFNDSYLKSFEKLFPTNQVFEFSINGIAKKIAFNSVSIKVEGYSGFVSVADTIDTKQDLLSIDVGGGTTDLCSYKYDYEDEMYYPDTVDTITKGVIDFSEEISIYFNDVNNADITKDNIDQILNNDLDIIEYKDAEYKLEDYINIIKPTTDNMINKITNKFGQLDRYAIVGVGGGYKTFYKMVKENISNEIKIEEDKQFYANAIGFLAQ